MRKHIALTEKKYENAPNKITAFFRLERKNTVTRKSNNYFHHDSAKRPSRQSEEYSHDENTHTKFT